MTTDASNHEVTASEESTGPEIEFSWRAHPAREQPGRAGLGAIVMLAVGGVVGAIFAIEGAAVLVSIGCGLLAVGVLVLALNRFYLPSRFELDAESITAHYFFGPRRIEWANVRRFLHDANGGYLSRRARRSRMDAWKGLHILFGDSRDEAIARIKDYVALQDEEGEG